MFFDLSAPIALMSSSSAGQLRYGGSWEKSLSNTTTAGRAAASACRSDDILWRCPHKSVNAGIVGSFAVLISMTTVYRGTGLRGAATILWYQPLKSKILCLMKDR